MNIHDFRPNHLKKALFVGGGVWFCLMVINYWDFFLLSKGEFTYGLFVKTLMNFVIPFVLSLLFSMSTESEVRRRIKRMKQLEMESSRVIQYPGNQQNSSKKKGDGDVA